MQRCLGSQILSDPGERAVRCGRPVVRPATETPRGKEEWETAYLGKHMKPSSESLRQQRVTREPETAITQEYRGQK